MIRKVWKMGPEDLTFDRHVLRFKKFAQTMAVDAGIMAEISLSMDPHDYDFLRDQVVVKMVTKLLTDDLPPETVEATRVVVFREPASTWQMWKRNNRHKWYTWKWLNAWIGRWPVKTVEIKKSASVTMDLTRFRAYPKALVQSPILGEAVMFHDIRDVRWDVEEEPRP
jgi:hypothetical protein